MEGTSFLLSKRACTPELRLQRSQTGEEAAQTEHSLNSRRRINSDGSTIWRRNYNCLRLNLKLRSSNERKIRTRSGISKEGRNRRSTITGIKPVISRRKRCKRITSSRRRKPAEMMLCEPPLPRVNARTIGKLQSEMIWWLCHTSKPERGTGVDQNSTAFSSSLWKMQEREQRWERKR